VVTSERRCNVRILTEIQDSLPSVGVVDRQPPIAPHDQRRVGRETMLRPVLAHRIEPGLVDKLEQTRGG
jgi:hypothetical protein